MSIKQESFYRQREKYVLGERVCKVSARVCFSCSFYSSCSLFRSRDLQRLYVDYICTLHGIITKYRLVQLRWADTSSLSFTRRDSVDDSTESVQRNTDENKMETLRHHRARSTFFRQLIIIHYLSINRHGKMKFLKLYWWDSNGRARRQARNDRQAIKFRVIFTYEK